VARSQGHQAPLVIELGILMVVSEDWDPWRGASGPHSLVPADAWS
jgi:hypothetical protein